MLISLGIGDTTEPTPEVITSGKAQAQAHFLNMLGLLESVLVGLWLQRSFYIQMDFQLPRISTALLCTAFNGASNISQAGGLACLKPAGLEAMYKVVGFYKENTNIIMETFTSLGFSAYGGKNVPYVWVHFPGRSSWDVFSEILEKTHVVVWTSW